MQRETKGKRKQKLVEQCFTAAYPLIAYKAFHVYALLETVLQQITEGRKIPKDAGRMGVSHSLLPKETHLPCSSLYLPYSLCTHPMVALDPESRLLMKEGGVEHLPKHMEIKPIN